MDNNESKKELKVVFSDEIYNELKYVFRPDRLENVIYRPMMKEDGKWLCTCGFETDLGMCPICGMEKATVFSKVNANYLARHRKERLLRKQKSGKSRKKDLAASSAVKRPSQGSSKGKKIATLIGVAVLLAAIAVSVFLLVRDNTPKTDPDTTDRTISFETDIPETGNGPSSVDTEPVSSADPETDETPETDKPDEKEFSDLILNEIDSPYETANAEGGVATLKISEWAKGESGNANAGGKVFVSQEHDYLAKDGISEYDKNGVFVRKVTDTIALSLTGNDTYIFFTDGEHKLRRVTYDGMKESIGAVSADKLIVFGNKLFYTPYGEDGLYSLDPVSGILRQVTSLKVTSLNVAAGKLYFSTSESLAVLVSPDGAMMTFCKDGANAESIMEFDTAVYYTSNGNFRLYKPEKLAVYGVDYGTFYPGGMYAGQQFRGMVQFDDRLYYKAEFGGTSMWYADTVLFAGTSETGVTTPDIYATDNGFYDGELNFHSVK